MKTNRSPGGCPTVSGSSIDNSGGPWKNQHLELDWNRGGLVLGLVGGFWEVAGVEVLPDGLLTTGSPLNFCKPSQYSRFQTP